MVNKFLLIGFANLSKILVGFFLLKLATEYLTPSEFGMIGHYISFISLIYIFSGGGISNGIIAIIGRNSANVAFIEKTKTTLFMFSIFFSICLSILILLLSNNISAFVFKDQSYDLFISLSAAYITFFSIINFLIAYLNGFSRTKDYVFIQIVGSTFAIALGYLAISNYGIYGAISAYSLQFLSLLIPSIFFFRSLVKIKFSFQYFDIDILKQALKFSVIAIIGIFSVPLTEFFIRESIIINLGYEYSGYWQSLNRISVAVISFFITFFTYFLLPKINKSAYENIKIYKKISFGIIPLFILLSVFLVTFDEMIIRIFLSQDYLEIANYFYLQFSGDFFKMLSYFMIFLAISRAAIKTIIFIESAQFILLYFITSINLASKGSLFSVYESYLIAYFIFFVIVSIWFFNAIRK